MTFAKNSESSKELIAICNRVDSSIETRKPGEYDAADTRSIKTLIRRTEARSAAMTTGVKKSNVYHLDLPFYETGAIKKAPMGPRDIKIVKDLIIK